VKDRPEIIQADAREITQQLVELLKSGKLDEGDP